MPYGVRNRRVLIVEDNALIGTFMADVIEEAGGSAIGPVFTRQEALDLLDAPGHLVDVAILDLWLDGASYCVADRLRAAGVPFIFATGNPAGVPADHAGRPVCAKPFTPQSLLASLRAAFEREAAAPLRPAADLG